MTISHMTQEEFKDYLERRLRLIHSELAELAELHAQYPETLQLHYLLRARNSLQDGLNWFKHFRKAPQPEAISLTEVIAPKTV